MKHKARVVTLLQLLDGDSRITDFARLITPAEKIDFKIYWQDSLAKWTLFPSVVHIHWPEQYFRARNGFFSLLKFAQFMARLLLWKSCGTRVVRTLHNESPHEKLSSVERFMISAVEWATDYYITLNRHTVSPAPQRTTLIPHARYKVPQNLVNQHHRSGLLYFGFVRKYKGLENLLQVFAEIEQPHLSLTIMGKPLGWTADSLRSAARKDERVRLQLGFVEEETLIEAISSCSLVVLPYEKMHNSGAVFLALSSGSPVLIPSNDINRELAEEVGQGWVFTYDPPLMARDIVSALNTINPSAQPPNLSDRDIEQSQNDHERIYRTVSSFATARCKRG